MGYDNNDNTTFLMTNKPFAVTRYWSTHQVIAESWVSDYLFLLLVVLLDLRYLLKHLNFLSSFTCNAFWFEYGVKLRKDLILTFSICTIICQWLLQLCAAHKLSSKLKREIILGSSSLDDPPQFITVSFLFMSPLQYACCTKNLLTCYYLQKLKMLSTDDLTLDDLQI